MESDSDDDSFEEDMEALKRACYLTNRSNTDATADPIQPRSGRGVVAVVNASEDVDEGESSGEEDQDIQLLQSIQYRFSFSAGLVEPLRRRRMASSSLDSDFSDSEDDYETLRAIHRRFAAYDDGGLKNIASDVLQGPEQVGVPILDSIKETSNSSVERSNAREGFVNCVDMCKPMPQKESCDDANGSYSSDLVDRDGQADDTALIPYEHSHSPDSALTFFDAIKKNRSYQKLIRSKMIQMESRIEELKKLIERVKILKDFQIACKKRTGRAFSQKKDYRVQLISKRKVTENLKSGDKKLSVICKGPPENPHVANYRKAMMAFGIPMCRKSWSGKERENLVKGVKQQFQELLLCRSVDLLSEEDGSNLDSLLLSIKHVDITPERIRSFLPKVNWEQLAAMYVPGRTGEECQTRFLNFEDPLINHGPWKSEEDKILLHIIQQRGLSNWIEIAASLGTNRTPFECLVRYQRSLNASIIKRKWTKEEDCQLREAVKKFGTGDWQLVASVMEGRTGTQCSTRWLKSLHPARERGGRWSADEKKRLEVAVRLFGPQTWKKIASYVPGRTGVQCSERWLNCSDPSLSTAPWSDEEDRKLEAAVLEHGYCWANVAACIPPRTRGQCWRRWKVLYPNDARRHQEARKMGKAALISNFVDREKERPDLKPTDFIIPGVLAIESNCAEPSQRKKRKPRSKKVNDATKNGCHGVAMLTDRVEIENSQSATVPTTRSGSKRTVSKKKKANPPCSQSQLGPNTPALEMPNAESMDPLSDEEEGRLPHSGNTSLTNTQTMEQITIGAKATGRLTIDPETCSGDIRTQSMDEGSSLLTPDPTDMLMKDVDKRERSSPNEINFSQYQSSENISDNISMKVPDDSTAVYANSNAGIIGSQSGNGDTTLLHLQNGETHLPCRKVSGSKRKRENGVHVHQKKRLQTGDEVGDDTILSEFYKMIKKRK